MVVARKIFFNILMICAVSTIIVLASVSVSLSGENVLGLMGDGYYDIYVGGYEGVSIIKNVEIAGFREIREKVFLVIHADRFAARRSEGLILFDYVQAVLPSHKVVQYFGAGRSQ